jgi:hypothetical protein
MRHEWHDGEKFISPLDQRKRPAGITPPTLSCNCRLAGPVPLPLYSELLDRFDW